MSPPTATRARLDPAEALAVLGASFLLLATVGGWLQLRFGFAGVALAELAAVLLPTVIALGAWRVSPVSALGLELPPARALVGAVLVAVGGFQLVSGGLEPLQEHFVPLPPALREQLHRLMVPDAGPRLLVLDLLVLAVAPALCEEVLFRGTLLRGLSVTGRVASLVATAFAFGCFHFSFYKLLPTLAIGLFLGALALRSRSLWPSMVAHAVNNTLVVLLVRAGYDDEPPALSSRWLLLPAVAAVTLGLVLAGPRAADGKS